MVPRLPAATPPPCGLQADIVILTNNNPRTEDPSGIIADIQAGYPNILLQVSRLLLRTALHVLHVSFWCTAWQAQLHGPHELWVQRLARGSARLH